VEREKSSAEVKEQVGVLRVIPLTPQRVWGRPIAGLESLFLAELPAPQGFRIECVLGAGALGGVSVEKRHIQSFLSHVAMAAANRLLHEQEILRGQQSREFVGRLLKAQEEERLRIARELHDTLAQELAAHKLELERISKAPGLREEDRAVIVALEAQAYAMLTTLRRLLVDLRPSVLDTMGFLPALQWYLEKLQQESQIKGRLSVEGDEIKLSHSLEITLFRIFQECLRNIQVHSGAEHVIATVTYGERDLEITIEDDGKGFNVEEVTRGTVRPDGHGLGLLGMIERAKLLGGRIVFESAPEEGTTITVSIPLQKDVK
jgi:signal transduction histidine kinase